jgi:hypothetical protein
MRIFARTTTIPDLIKRLSMPARSSTAIALLVSVAMVWAGSCGLASAQPGAAAQDAHPIPQSLVYEHQDTMERLKALSARPGRVGEAAQRALELFKRHTQREQDYILPPLTLLPDIADGHVTPDMQWALDMADRVRADRELIFQEHTEVTDVLNALLMAGEDAHDQEAVDFARSAAADSLNDIEILEPTVVMIGDVLRAKLAPAH